VIGAVNGPAIGFGAALAAVCDLVVMDEDAYLSEPHAGFGIDPSPGIALAWPLLTSLAVAPRSFRPLKRGGAVVSATRPKRGTTVRYALTGAAMVAFTVERAARGRIVGGKCRKQTSANRGKRKCTRFEKLKGGFFHQGAAGANGFRFSGRLRGLPLKPGRYRLVGRTGGASRSARFTILR